MLLTNGVFSGTKALYIVSGKWKNGAELALGCIISTEKGKGSWGFEV